jgi:hypothetical protein
VLATIVAGVRLGILRPVVDGASVSEAGIPAE